MTSRKALELREVPESIAIVGGWPIGVEFAYFYRAYGSEVTIIEMLDHLLRLEDEDIGRSSTFLSSIDTRAGMPTGAFLG
jgi:dihydrolipoamide dehydrogenase